MKYDWGCGFGYNYFFFIVVKFVCKVYCKGCNIVLRFIIFCLCIKLLF